MRLISVVFVALMFFVVADSAAGSCKSSASCTTKSEVVDSSTSANGTISGTCCKDGSSSCKSSDGKCTSKDGGTCKKGTDKGNCSTSKTCCGEKSCSKK